MENSKDLRGKFYALMQDSTASPTTDKIQDLFEATLDRIAELEKDRERINLQWKMALKLARTRESRLDAIRDCLRQNKGDDLIRVEVAWLLDCSYSDLDAEREASNEH